MICFYCTNFQWPCFEPIQVCYISSYSWWRKVSLQSWAEAPKIHYIHFFHKSFFWRRCVVSVWLLYYALLAIQSLARMLSLHTETVDQHVNRLRCDLRLIVNAQLNRAPACPWLQSCCLIIVEHPQGPNQHICSTGRCVFPLKIIIHHWQRIHACILKYQDYNLHVFNTFIRTSDAWATKNMGDNWQIFKIKF